MESKLKLRDIYHPPLGRKFVFFRYPQQHYRWILLYDKDLIHILGYIEKEEGVDYSDAYIYLQQKLKVFG
jgi:hypothetical protein